MLVVLEESASCPMTFLESQHTDRHEESSANRPRGRNVIRSDGSVPRDALIYSGRLFQINGQANGESESYRIPCTCNVPRQLVHAF